MNSLKIKSKARTVLETVFKPRTRNFNVQLPDGDVMKWTDHPVFTLVLNDWRTVREIVFHRDDYTVGKAFIEKRLDVKGDIFSAMTIGDYLSQLRLRPGELCRVANALLFR